MTNLPNTNKGDKYEPINGIYSHEIAEPLLFWYGCALKYVWRAPRKGKKKSLRKAAGALRAILADIQVNGAPSIVPVQATDYWGKLRAFRADLVERGKESVHAQLIVSVLDIILLHEADHLTMSGRETQCSFEEGAQYAQTILDAINLIESTSKKGLLTTKTAWDVSSNFPPI